MSTSIEPLSKSRPLGGRLCLIILCLLAVFPAVLPVWMMCRDGVDVPYYDQWDPDIFNVIAAASRGSISPDVFTQHNEHRIFVPKLIDSLLARVTHWNQFGEMALSFIVVCATSAGLLILCRRTASAGRINAQALCLWVLCNLLLFTPAQNENWLWGIGPMNVLQTLALVAAMCTAVSGLGMRVKLTMCILLASSATFTAGNGMLAWPLIGLALAGQSLGAGIKNAAMGAGAWIAAFGINLLLYFHDYQTPAPSPKLPFPGAGMGTELHYVLAFCGAPLAFSTSLDFVWAATIMGTCFLIVFIFIAGWYVRQWYSARDADLRRRMLPWLLLGGYAVGSGMMAAIGRREWGAQQALSSRYAAYAVFLPMSLAAMLCINAGAARKWETVEKCCVSGFVTVLVLLQLLAIGPGFAQADQMRIARLGAKAALLAVNIVPDSDLIPALLYHTPAVLQTEANILNKAGWIHPPLLQSDRANLIDEKSDLAAGLTAQANRGALEQMGKADNDRLVATGWSVTADQTRPSDAVLLTYEDDSHDPKIFWIAQVGQARQEVARKLGNPDLLRCGWIAVFPAAKLPLNVQAFHVRAWAFDADTGKAFPLDGEANMSPQPAAAK